MSSKLRVRQSPRVTFEYFVLLVYPPRLPDFKLEFAADTSRLYQLFAHMYSNRMLRHTSCRAVNAYDVGSAMLAAFCCPARLPYRAVATAALRARIRYTDTSSAASGIVDEDKTASQRDISHWRASEQYAKQAGKETRGGEDKAKEDMAVAGKLSQYEMLLHGSEFGSQRQQRRPREGRRPLREQTDSSMEQSHRLQEQPRVARDQPSRSREEAQEYYARKGAARIVEDNDTVAERLIATGNNTATGWTPHMMHFSQRLRDPEKKKSMALEDFDYIGLPIQPQSSSVDTPLPVPWALSVEERHGLTASQLLDEEIRRFVLSMQPTPKEKNGRIRVAEQARTRVQGVFGEETHVTLFGSSQTKTEMPFSDIDIHVNTTGKTRQDHESDMRKLFHELDHSHHYFCVVFRGGKFPIITAQHVYSGLDIQVVAGVDARHTPKVNATLDNTPHLRPLYSVVRMMLGIRGFVNPFIGGISAYGTMMMMAASIKLRQNSEPTSTSDTAATQLLHYLDLFANFDTTKDALSVDPPLILPKHTERSTARPYNSLKGPSRHSKETLRTELHRMAQIRPQQPYLLALQDPTNPVNDLGGRCHAIKHILRTIQHLNEELRASMQMYDEARDQGKPLQGEFSLLLPLVGRCHEVYAERRAKLTEFAYELQSLQNEKKNKRKSERLIRFIPNSHLS